MPKFNVTRSIEIAAPPERVFEVVSDFSSWTSWSPWLIAEPEAKVTVSPDSKSVGSTYEWGGKVTGAGKMTHKVVDGPGRLVSKIEFFRPMKSVSDVTFDLKPTDAGTHISWGMKGSLPWYLFWMVKMMDPFIGMDYERGLKMLKEWIEDGAVKSKVDVHGKAREDAIRMSGAVRTCALKDIGQHMESAYEEAKQKFNVAGASMDGDCMAVYTRFDMKTQSVDFIAGYSLPEGTPSPDGLQEWSKPAGSAFRVKHIGSYDHIGNGWAVANQHVRYKKLKQSKVGTYEIYRNSPEDTPAEGLITDIYLPLK